MINLKNFNSDIINLKAMNCLIFIRNCNSYIAVNRHVEHRSPLPEFYSKGAKWFTQPFESKISQKETRKLLTDVA